MKHLMESNVLVDSWRLQNSNSKIFYLGNKKHIFKRARLDYFLLGETVKSLPLFAYSGLALIVTIL